MSRQPMMTNATNTMCSAQKPKPGSDRKGRIGILSMILVAAGAAFGITACSTPSYPLSDAYYPPYPYPVPTQYQWDQARELDYQRMCGASEACRQQRAQKEDGLSSWKRSVVKYSRYGTIQQGYIPPSPPAPSTAPSVGVGNSSIMSRK